MKKINKKNWQAIIEGANLLGTGGGGTIEGAKNILQKITKPVTLTQMTELKDDQLICTVFGVGGKQNCDPILASQTSIQKFQQILGKQIAAIVPVENGPMAIANAMFIASELRLPILDSDIVGLRSSPEVFLETISIPNLQRTPCVISDGKQTKIIKDNLSLEEFEKKLRDFAIASGGDAIVTGYPLSIKQIKNILPNNSVSIAQRNGELLRTLRRKEITLQQFYKKSGWRMLGEGKIVKMQKDTSKGFSEGIYKIIISSTQFEVFFKNENLVITKNGRTLLTCPDSISLLDAKKWQALNNFNDNVNCTIVILGRKAIPIWRTKKGTQLFSPKKLGLNFEQKLL